MSVLNEPHPWYGGCDGFGPNGECSECTGQIQCDDGSIIQKVGSEMTMCPPSGSALIGKEQSSERRAAIDTEELRLIAQYVCYDKFEDRYRTPYQNHPAWKAAEEIDLLRKGLTLIAGGEGDAQEIAQQTLNGAPPTSDDTFPMRRSRRRAQTNER